MTSEIRHHKKSWIVCVGLLENYYELLNESNFPFEEPLVSRVIK